MASDDTEAGSQYDNHASQFKFSRPGEYINDELMLMFDDGKRSFAPLNIGTENRFSIPNALTQATVLHMQAAFKHGEDKLACSNVVIFRLRPSINSGAIPVESWPDSAEELAALAFRAASFEDGIL